MGTDAHWTILKHINVPTPFQDAVGGHPLVAQALYQRGYKSIECALAFLNPKFYQPAPPNELQDMEIACQLLEQAILKKHHILVWGDFDVDGQTATTILVEGLRQVGGQVKYHIPVRAVESHGIKLKALEAELNSGFDLLITCDTGISEHENIQLVRNLGIPVIVTDHHSLGEKLPPANAVINPQRLELQHPLRSLPGAGVAYKLIEGLFNHLGVTYNLKPLLELAALGIVADVASLEGDTRFILQTGLHQLQQTHRVGLQMLYQNMGLNSAHLNEGHIGFQIAPRLNAVGRLADANPMVEFLSTQDEARARALVYQIEAYNSKRRFDTRQIEQGAEAQLSALSSDKYAPAIVLHHPTWPAGVVGIVASRLVERYHKPVILLTGEETIHGSARSVPGLNITQTIAEQADLLNNFGGHPMAAGLSMPPQNLTAFKRRFLSAVEAQLKGVQVIKEIQVAQILTLDQVNINFIREIERLAPFGPGNPALLFQLCDLKLVSSAKIGTNKEHRHVIISDKDEHELRLLWWNGGDENLPDAEFDLVCKLTLSDYKGTEQISAEWIDYKLSEAGIQTLAERHIDIIDKRGSLNPIIELGDLLKTNPGVNLWGEGSLPEGFPFQSRNDLAQNSHLVIWSAPPSQTVLKEVITHTKPKMVTIFAEISNLDDYNVFINRVGGIAKFALSNFNGKVNLERAAAVCSASEETVALGIRLWAAKGAFQVSFDDDIAYISPLVNQPNLTAIKQYEDILKKSLEESAAFRSYFIHGDINTLLTYSTSK